MIRLRTVLLALMIPPLAAFAMDWEEAGLPCGGHLIVAGGDDGGWVSCVLAFPAGVSESAETPATAHLALRLMLDAAGSGTSLAESLADLGWQARLEMSEDVAMLILSGASENLEKLIGPIDRAIRNRTDFDTADLDRVRRALETDYRRWEANPEAKLRALMARKLFGAHPYGAGRGHRPGSPPTADQVRTFLETRFSPGGMQILLAGDLVARDALESWTSVLDRLEGPRPLRAKLPKPLYGKGRITGEPSPRGLLLVQLPGLPVDDPRASQLALASGIIQLLCEADLRDAGLARSVSSWYRFTADGPAALEITLRGLGAEQLGMAEAVLDRILERLREGDFSEYMVISAKDRILQRLEIHSAQGELPSKGVVELAAWSAETSRQALLLRGKRGNFESRLLLGNIGSISAFCSDWLLPEYAVVGVSMP